MTAPRTYRLMNFVENNLALVLIAAGVIIVDRVVKFYVTEYLRIGESIPVLGRFFMITRSQNAGAGFGILQGQNWLFVLAAVIVMGLMIFYYQQIIWDRLLLFASGFILAGTVGNMMDRVFFGYVIDYMDFSFWPTFNMSDASLVIGVGLLIAYLYFWQKEPVDHEKKYVHY